MSPESKAALRLPFVVPAGQGIRQIFPCRSNGFPHWPAHAQLLQSRAKANKVPHILECSTILAGVHQLPHILEVHLVNTGDRLPPSCRVINKLLFTSGQDTPKVAGEFDLLPLCMA